MCAYMPVMCVCVCIYMMYMYFFVTNKEVLFSTENINYFRTKKLHCLMINIKLKTKQGINFSWGLTLKSPN